MTIGLTNSYTTVAVIPEFPASGRVTSAPSGIYTCPPNKKAKITASMILDAVGADSIYALAVKRGLVYIPIGAFIGTGPETTSKGEAILEAGDILTNIGNSGSTNGTVDIDAMIQEIDV